MSMTSERNSELGDGLWAYVEIMGHRSYSGFVREAQVGGTTLMRVDVPATKGSPAWTTYFGASAIFSMTPVTEEMARAWAERGTKPQPSILALPVGDRAPDEEDQAGW